MPNAILVYSLPDEQNEYTLAKNGDRYWHCLWDISEALRRKLKYEDSSLSADELKAYQSMHKAFYEILETNGVNLDDVN